MLQMLSGQVELLPVNEDMSSELGKLEAEPAQKRFIKPLQTPKTGKRWKQAAIVLDGTLIGWTRYGLNRLEDDGATDFPNPIRSEENAWIDVFFIDRRYQGMGYGSIALQRLLGAILHEYHAYSTYVGVHPDNARGVAMLESNGFRQTGEASPNGEMILEHQL